MSGYSIGLVACLALPFGMYAFAVQGHRIGRRKLLSNPEAKEFSTSTVDAAVLSLLGLLTAFTFSSAYSRYETRRQLIVDEANAIGTAYLRVGLLPAGVQPEMRELFREYVGTRTEMWEALPDREAALQVYSRTADLQQQIWTAAIDATDGETAGDARKLLIPALNEMIDITTTRLIAVQSHPPTIVFALLFTISLVAAWLVGFGMSNTPHPSYWHIAGFACLAALAFYVIIDIEYPRRGIVTLDQPHELFTELQQSME